ncbi:MAG: hypothetical protein AABZ47_17585 [Planctomycetota bacterium]
MTAVFVTLLFLPVYWFARRAFRDLPLHIDTGFYVSNHTICTGRFEFSKGWNARHAGCSKLLPEWFYSTIYLWARHRPTNEDGLPRYVTASRSGASLFNYVTAIVVGVLVWHYADGDIRYYFAGLVLFGLGSSESQYGVYHECAELFELLPQVAGLCCLQQGLNTTNGWWVFAGTLLWALEVFFVKLSSGLAFAVLFGGVGLFYFWAVPMILLAGGIGGLAYLFWLRKNHRTFRELLPSLRGHEAHFAPRMNLALLRHRLQEKFRCLFRAIARQPFVPMLGIVGLGSSPNLPGVFWLYLAGVLVTYLFQATDCRYYMIPLLPILSLVAAFGAVEIATAGLAGIVALGLIILGWVLFGPVRAWRMSREERNRWCWEGFRPCSEIDRNVALEESVKPVRPILIGKNLLIYGPLNQGYVLLGASYPTPIVAPEHYMGDVHGEWQSELNDQLVSSPPTFILDTAAVFDANETREMIGLDYRLFQVLSGGFRLYELQLVTPPRESFRKARTFRSVSRAEWDTGSTEKGVAIADDTASSDLQLLLSDLSHRGYKRVAIYGAGRFTIRHAEVYRCSPVPIVTVLDDSASKFDGQFLDWPVRFLTDVQPPDFDAVIISSDRFEGPMLRQVRRHLGDHIPAFTLKSPRS